MCVCVRVCHIAIPREMKDVLFFSFSMHSLIQMGVRKDRRERGKRERKNEREKSISVSHFVPFTKQHN